VGAQKGALELNNEIAATKSLSIRPDI